MDRLSHHHPTPTTSGTPYTPVYTLYGQMLHAMQYSHMWPQIGEPLKHMIEVIYNQFPSGATHIWSLGLNDRNNNRIHFPELIAAGTVYIIYQMLVLRVVHGCHLKNFLIHIP